MFIGAGKTKDKEFFLLEHDHLSRLKEIGCDCKGSENSLKTEENIKIKYHNECYIEQINGENRKRINYYLFAYYSNKIQREYSKYQYYQGRVFKIGNEKTTKESMNEFVKAISKQIFEINEKNCFELLDISKEWEISELTKTIKIYLNKHYSINACLIIQQYLQNLNKSFIGNCYLDNYSECNEVYHEKVREHQKEKREEKRPTEYQKQQEYLEKKMCERIEDCLQNEYFGNIPISTVYRIIENTFNHLQRNRKENSKNYCKEGNYKNTIENNKNDQNDQNISNTTHFDDLLLEFICNKSIERMILMKFIDISRLTKENQEKIFRSIMGKGIEEVNVNANEKKLTRKEEEEYQNQENGIIYAFLQFPSNYIKDLINKEIEMKKKEDKLKEENEKMKRQMAQLEEDIISAKTDMRKGEEKYSKLQKEMENELKESENKNKKENEEKRKIENEQYEMYKEFYLNTEKLENFLKEHNFKEKIDFKYFEIAIEKGNLDIVRIFLNKDPSLIIQKNGFNIMTL